MTRHWFVRALLGGCVVGGCSDAPAAPGGGRAAPLLQRDFEPVVLTGDSIPSLVGTPPARIVGYRFDAAGWTRIPVQVDERAMVAIGDAYRGLDPATCAQPGWCSELAGRVAQIYYTDAKTFIGADPDVAFDRNDELVFMTRDAGSEAPVGAARPPGVSAGSGVKLTVSEPQSTGRSYVYLFTRSDTVATTAIAPYVVYNFAPAAGEYRATYDRAGLSPDANRRTGDAAGANPENSTVTTRFYSQHFADRWILDRLQISAGSSTAVDILDRYKNSFGPGSCARTEYTGSRSEGAFIVNISGPVRAIRAYVGFNSGPLVQREHLFYEQYSEITTFLRVHPIPGIVDFLDYSPAASGMTYRNNLNPQGVTIDGRPDVVRTGPLEWESVQGPPGTMVTTHTVSTNISGLARTSFYDDAITSSFTQCTGDEFAYGASGSWVTSNIPNTDPRLGATSTLSLRRQMVFRAPNVSTTTIDSLVASLRAPVSVKAEAIRTRD